MTWGEVDLFEVEVVPRLEGEGVARQGRLHLSRVEPDHSLAGVQHWKGLWRGRDERLVSR